MGDRASYVANRWRNIGVSTGLYQFSRRRPAAARKFIRRVNTKLLPEGYDVDTHFNPPYDPWDQRMCLVPDSDLFTEISRGRAEVVTGHIERFTRTGVRLIDGTELEADVIVTATGLNLLAFGGMALSVDGQAVDLPETMAYKALMLSGVPNFAFTIGYTNASWTLKADLVAEYVCRLLSHLDETGRRFAVPVADPRVRPEPFMDFEAGYVLRALDRLPKQGDVEPWKLRQSYVHDMRSIRRGAIDDGVLRWSSSRGRRSGERGEEVLDAQVDLVADLADGVDALAGGVVELPVLVALAGEDRAGVAAAHGDHHVGGWTRPR